MGVGLRSENRKAKVELDTQDAKKGKGGKLMVISAYGAFLKSLFKNAHYKVEFEISCTDFLHLTTYLRKDARKSVSVRALGVSIHLRTTIPFRLLIPALYQPPGIHGGRRIPL